MEETLNRETQAASGMLREHILGTQRSVEIALRAIGQRNNTLKGTLMRTNDVAAQLRDLEAQRCAAMVAADLPRLRQLLHRNLVHVHAKGQVDGYESYFATGGFKVNYTRLERGDLTVRVFGDTALMTGRQLLEAIRKSNGERVRIDSQVMQVWVREGTSWRQVAFQTTPSEHTVTPAA